jgi:CubicO group peptidase (beta-lactamase class C family)
MSSLPFCAAIHALDLEEPAWIETLFQDGRSLFDEGEGLFVCCYRVGTRPPIRLGALAGEHTAPCVWQMLSGWRNKHAHGRGFGIGWFWPHPYGWWQTGSCYGHAGNFSTLGWADPTTGCATATATNGNRAPAKLVTRCAPIGSAVRAACVD